MGWGLYFDEVGWRLYFDEVGWGLYFDGGGGGTIIKIDFDEVGVEAL